MSERLETKRCIKALYKYSSFPYDWGKVPNFMKLHIVMKLTSLRTNFSIEFQATATAIKKLHVY